MIKAAIGARHSTTVAIVGAIAFLNSKGSALLKLKLVAGQVQQVQFFQDQAPDRQFRDAVAPITDTFASGLFDPP